MKRKKGAIDLTGWTLSSIDELHKGMDQLLLSACKDVLEIAMDSEEAYIDLPAIYGNDRDGHGGPGVSDPLTVYFASGLGGVVHDGPLFEFSLRESLQGFIDQCADDGSYSSGLSRVSVALRGLADEIDRAVKKSEPTDPL